jgi:hypothetical protein
MDETPSLSTPVKSRSLAPIGVLFVGAIAFVWLLMLFMDKNFYNQYGMDLTKEMWRNIGAIIMVALIGILFAMGLPSKSPVPEAAGSGEFTSITPAVPKSGVVVSSAPAVESPSQDSGDVVEAEPLVVEAEIVEVEAIEVEEIHTRSSLKMQKAKLVEYPKKVPGGVYGDTIIRADPLTKLNLRTLLVRSCMICDRQGKCWEEFMDTVPRDEFLENTECKKGLRNIRGPGGGSAPRKLKKKKRKTMQFDEEEL